MLPKISIVPSDASLRKVRKATTAAIPRTLGILDMIALAWRRKAALLIGAIFGAAVSAGTYWVWHHELHTSGPYTLDTFLDPRVVLVAGGLCYSVGTVVELASKAFGKPWKAIAFTVYMEALMVLSGTWWVNIIALVYLASLNALGTGVVVARGARDV